MLATFRRQYTFLSYVTNPTEVGTFHPFTGHEGP